MKHELLSLECGLNPVLRQMGMCIDFSGISTLGKVPTTVTNCTSFYLQPSGSAESHVGLWQGWTWKPLPESS